MRRLVTGIALAILAVGIAAQIPVVAGVTDRQDAAAVATAAPTSELLSVQSAPRPSFAVGPVLLVTILACALLLASRSGWWASTLHDPLHVRELRLLRWSALLTGAPPSRSAL